MTSKDNAGDKLVASIRKTRSSSSSTAATQDAKPAATAPVAKKAVRKKAVAKKKVSANREAKARLVSTFKHGKRVWPD